MSLSSTDQHHLKSAEAEPSERRLRVMMMVNMFPKPGREEMGVWALGQAAALVRQGVDLTVVSMVPWVPRFLGRLGERFHHWALTPEKFSYRGVPVIYVRWPLYQTGRMKQIDYRWPAIQHGLAWTVVRNRVIRLTEEIKPDVIYAHHTWNSGDLAYRLKRRFGIPYVVQDHHFEEIRSCEDMPARRRYFDRVMHGASHLVPVSARMDGDIRRIFPGVHTTILHNGSELLPAQIAQKPRPPELAQKQVVLCVANLFACKNVPVLVRAFDRAASKHPQAVLRIIGDGDRAPMQEAIRQSANGDRIQYLGFLKHDQVLQEMAWSDIFAMIGENESWGVVYNEAMSAGLPILCANDGGINDVVVPEVHGLSVPPRDVEAAANALDRLLGDEALRRRMGQATKQLFEDSLTWDQNARSLIEILRAAATGAGQLRSA